ncbi:MAG: Maf family protein [Acidobacteria bacterium]|nr:Maf family protein [Acidobacteriota bacterium]
MSRTTPLGAPAFWPAAKARPRSGEPESRLALASASPRRRELLESLDLDFIVRPAAVDETPNPGERPRDLVRRLAREKAEAAGRDGEWVLAADTIVVENGDVLGKPRDRDHAREMLQRLQGRWHLVLTGVALRPPDGDTLHAVESTRVLFAELTPEQIDWYAATGEPHDKAGAYAVQGLGALFVSEIDGNYSNVVGLPLPTVRQLFEGAGSDVRVFRRAPARAPGPPTS